MSKKPFAPPLPRLPRELLDKILSLYISTPALGHPFSSMLTYRVLCRQFYLSTHKEPIADFATRRYSDYKVETHTLPLPPHVEVNSHELAVTSLISLLPNHLDGLSSAMDLQEVANIFLKHDSYLRGLLREKIAEKLPAPKTDNQLYHFIQATSRARIQVRSIKKVEFDNSGRKGFFFKITLAIKCIIHK